MPYCEHCGAKTSEEAAFCRSCGVAVASELLQLNTQHLQEKNSFTQTDTPSKNGHDLHVNDQSPIEQIHSDEVASNYSTMIQKHIRKVGLIRGGLVILVILHVFGIVAYQLSIGTSVFSQLSAIDGRLSLPDNPFAFIWFGALYWVFIRGYYYDCEDIDRSSEKLKKELFFGLLCGSVLGIVSYGLIALMIKTHMMPMIIIFGVPGIFFIVPVARSVSSIGQATGHYCFSMRKKSFVMCSIGGIIALVFMELVSQARILSFDSTASVYTLLGIVGLAQVSMLWWEDKRGKISKVVVENPCNDEQDLTKQSICSADVLATPVSSIGYCEECGKELNENETHCPFCNTKVLDQPIELFDGVQEEKQRQQERRSSQRGFFNRLVSTRNNRKILIGGSFLCAIFTMGIFYYNFAYYSTKEIQDAIKLRNDLKLGNAFDYSIKNPRHRALATAVIEGITEIKGKDGLNRLNAFMYKSDNGKDDQEYHDQLRHIIVSKSRANKVLILPVFADIVKAPQNPLRSEVIDAIKEIEPTWFVGKIKEVFPKTGYYVQYDSKGKETPEENLENVSKQCQFWVVDRETKDTCAKEKAKRYGEILRRSIYGDARERNTMIDKIVQCLNDVSETGASRYIRILKDRSAEYDPVSNAYHQLKSKSSELRIRQKQIEDRMIALKSQYALLEQYAQQGLVGDREMIKGMEIANEYVNLSFERTNVQNEKEFIDQRKARVEKDEIRLRTALTAAIEQFY